jgi:hypothetical protein
LLAEERKDRNEGDEFKAFKELQVRLGVSTNRGECVEFSDAAERHGYTTERLRCRAGYCAVLLAQSKCIGVDALRLLLLSNNTPTLFVSAIGEGPGFSAVGIAAFMLFYGGETAETSMKTLNFACCDYEEGWAPSVEQMGRVIGRANGAIRDTSIQLHLSFQMCDVRYGLDHAKNRSLVASTKGELADVFIFSFVLVENAEQLRATHWHFMTDLLGGVCAGRPPDDDEAQVGGGKPRVALVMDSTHRIFPEVHEALGGYVGPAAAAAAAAAAGGGEADPKGVGSKIAEEGGKDSSSSSLRAERQWSAHLPPEKGLNIPRSKMVLLNAAARSLTSGRQRDGEGTVVADGKQQQHGAPAAESLEVQFEQMRLQSAQQAAWLRQNSKPAREPAGDSGGGSTQAIFVERTCGDFEGDVGRRKFSVGQELIIRRSDHKECATCAATGASVTCAKCKVPLYCSKACQRQHWRDGHKEVCLALGERRPETRSLIAVPERSALEDTVESAKAKS